METFFFLDLHQDDIVADLADAVPGDHILAFPAEKAAEPARTGDNQRRDPSGNTVKFHIDGTAQAAAGAGVDDLLLLQFTYTHGSHRFFSNICRKWENYTGSFVDIKITVIV